MGLRLHYRYLKQSLLSILLLTGLSTTVLLSTPAPVRAVELRPLEQQAVTGQPAETEKRPIQRRGSGNDRAPAQPGKNVRKKFEYKPELNKPGTVPGAPAAAAQEKSTGPGKVSVSGSADSMLFNFQDADIKAVIKTISQITGTNFVLDPRVKGKITIISAKPVSKAAAYDIFLSALKAQGFTAGPVTKGVIKIIPVGEGKQNASTAKWRLKRGGEQMISQVVVVQHGSATQLVPLLRPLMAPTSQLSAYAPANALILTDFANNIQRMLELIDELDKPLSTDVTVIPLQHASALDISELIGQLLEGGSAAGSAPAKKGGAQAALDSLSSIVPDLRTNSLLIRSDNPGRVAQLRKLIDKLDVPAKTGGNTRVVYLRNADAKSLVDILRGLLEAEAKKAQTATTGRPGARPAVAQPASQTSLIQADEATNSLIINASDAVYNNLRGVIEKLDVRRAQVFVEALLIEITSDKASELGFQWAAAQGVGDGDVGAISNFNIGTSLGGAIADPLTLAGGSGLTLAYLGPEITLADGTVINGLGGLARALETRSLANILSTPNLLTLDNAEAKIIVGQNVPFLTGSFAQATTGTGAINPFQTIERKDVGLTLQIKPQINEGGTVKLVITSEVSNVVRAATVGAQDLITNKRSLETTVVVEDGSTIALGGLIEDTSDESEQAIPLLGRIPLLGWLFKYKSKNKRKTNLMVFLKPTIVRSAQESHRFTADRYDYIIGEQREIIDKPEENTSIRRFKPEPPKEKEPGDDELREEVIGEQPVKEDELFGPTYVDPEIEPVVPDTGSADTPAQPSPPPSSSPVEPQS